MIVAIDITTLRGPLSGVGQYTARIVEYLGGVVGGEVSGVFLLSNGSVDRILPSSTRLVTGFRFPVRSVWMQFLLPLVLRKLRPDVVHYPNYLAPAFSGSPYVVSFHDMSLIRTPEHHTLKKRLLTARLMPWVARRSALVLTPSRAARLDVIADLGLDERRVVSIPYAAAEAFSPGAEPPGLPGGDRPYFLFVGTVEPRKNLVRLLNAFAAFAHEVPQVNLVMAGQRGWKCEEIYARAQRADLRERVILLGYVPEEALPSLYAHAVACVYPSLFEGFGFPVIEAMACGTPVLTSCTTSLGEIGEGAALLVDPLDERAITDGLLKIWRDAGLRADLRRRGLARARTFSWAETGRLTVAAYREALARPDGWPSAGKRE